MMVVHENEERPVEVAIIRKPLLEQKSYIIVKNHVKELSNITRNTTDTAPNEENSIVSLKRKRTIKERKCKKQKKAQEIPTTSSENDNINKTASEIDICDLNELKTVYTKCKEVIKRIESKYGHLLNIDSEEGSSGCRMKQIVYSESNEEKCHCKSKKKIVFDDEGRQSTVDVADNHICVQKTNVSSAPSTHRNIAVEYQDPESGLPETLQELREMLKDPDIEDTYRNRIFGKIRSIKAEYNNEIKFNKHILVEQLKTNPDNLLNFKGTNLSTILGYS